MMSGVNTSLPETPSNCHSVLEVSSLDYVGKVSRYLKSSMNQSSQDKVIQEDSDSGDSLFITQNPVPGPVRSGRRRRPHRSSWRSSPTSPLDSGDSDEDDSPPPSQSKSHNDKERQKKQKKHRLPKYSFPFLTERGWRARDTLLPTAQNISLHRHAMGGFFKCVRELLEASDSEDDSSLPTVDMDRDISPLPEEEEENAEDWDIRVVEKKCFLVPSKAKRQQTWSNQANVQQETTEEPQREMIRKTPRVTPGAERSNVGQSSRRVLFREERTDTRSKTKNTGVRPPREKQKEDLQQKAREEKQPERSPWKDTVTTVSEPQKDVSQRHNSSPAMDPDPESQNLHHGPPDILDDTTNDNICKETGVKKKKKKKDKRDHKSFEEGEDWSQEEPEGLQAAASVRVEEMPNLTEDTRGEISDDVDFKKKRQSLKKKGENECVEENLTQDEDANVRMEDSGTSVGDGGKEKMKKKKKKKDKGDNKSVEAGEVQSQEEPEGLQAAASVRVEVEVEVGETPDLTEQNRAEVSDEVDLNEKGGNECVEENVTQDEDGNERMEDSGISVGDGSKEKKKKKKKKKRKMADEDDEQLQSSAVIKPLNNKDDDAEAKRKKKKRKKDERLVKTDEEYVALKGSSDLPLVSKGDLEESGNAPDSQETSEPTCAKRKKDKKKKHLSSDDANQDGDVSFLDDSVTLAKCTKKKKKEKAISEGVGTPKENDMVENLDNTQRTEEGLEDENAELVTKKKKKKRKKTSEMACGDISENCVAQSDDSVSVQEKKKKRTTSFLDADAGGKERQHCSPSSVDVQKTHLGAGSAENIRNLEGSDHVTAKKKRKRRASVEEEKGQDFEELNETRERKKKRKRSESEPSATVEGSESIYDVGDVGTTKKKKKKKKKRDDGSTSETLTVVETPAETPERWG